MKTLFITGVARSGTSWLGKIFAAHPEVLYHFEPLNFLEGREALDSRLKYFGVQDRIMVGERNLLWEACARLWSLRDATLDRPPFFPQPREPRLMVLKDPAFARITDACAEIGRVLIIIRSPFAVINSLNNHTDFGRDYKVEGTAEYWAMVGTKHLAQAEREPERFRVVRYEDLVADPEEVGADLAAWAGMTWAQEQAWFVRDSHARHDGGQFEVFKDPAVVAADWKHRLSEEVVDRISRTVAGTDPGRLYGL